MYMYVLLAVITTLFIQNVTFIKHAWFYMIIVETSEITAKCFRIFDILGNFSYAIGIDLSILDSICIGEYHGFSRDMLNLSCI